MAYQPLYATVSDHHTTRSTTSLRGRVSEISGWLNSEIGEVMKWNASFTDGKEKVNKPDLRKIKKELREQTREEYEKEVQKMTKVNLGIDITENDRFNVSICGHKLKDLLAIARTLDGV